MLSNHYNSRLNSATVIFGLTIHPKSELLCSRIPHKDSYANLLLSCIRDQDFVPFVVWRKLAGGRGNPRYIKVAQGELAEGGSCA